MSAFLNLTEVERAQLFQEAAVRYSGIKDPIITEKDFWVCWILNQNYSNPELSATITSKGGTSL